MRAIVSMLGLGFLGCATPTVELQGDLVTTWMVSEAQPLPGATMTVLDDFGVEYDQTTTGEQGQYRVNAPSGQVVHVLSAADGYQTASFRGTSGMNPRLRIPRYLVHGVSDSERDLWTARLEGCESGEGEGLIAGEVRIENLQSEETGEHPIVITAYVKLLDDLGEEVGTPCYLDALGEQYDAEADRTGESGQFAIMGVPEGLFLMEVGYDVVGDVDAISFFEVWVPAGGVVPRFPLLLPFAF